MTIGRISMRSKGTRRVAILALALIIGATVSGDSRGVSAGDLGASFAGALHASSSIGRLTAAWANTAHNVASFGILYATVLTRMEPGVRKSILAAVDGVYEICTGHAIRQARPVNRCAAKPTSPKKTIRCSRA